MTTNRTIASTPVSLMLKFENTYQSTMIAIAISGCTGTGTSTKYPAAVTKMNATSGGSTTCTRKNSHWVAQPAVGFMALEDHTSTEDEYGNIDVSSANARPMGTRTTARIGKMRAAPAPVSSNQ